jgi:hypothetical protein
MASGVQYFPAVIPPSTVLGRLAQGVGPVEALPFAAIPSGGLSFTAAGTGAVSRSLQDKGRDWVSVKDFGAVGDGVTDDITAFNNAIASFGTGSGGGRLYVPRSGGNAYFLSGDLNISKQIQLFGDGGIDNFGTELLFADGKGLRIYHSADSPDGNDGSWSVISNLRILAQAQTASTSGIRISGHGVRVSNVSVRGFLNKGITIGDAANGGAGNANNWMLDNVRLTFNTSDGLFVDGGNSNAGTGILVDSSSNGGWGIFDSSFLGNTYIACHTASNISGGYKTDDPNAQNQLIGCYSESGQPASSLIAPTQVVGGIQNPGFTAASTHSYITGGGGNGLTRVTALQSSQIDNAAHTVESRVAGDVNNGDILYMSKSDVDSGSAYRLKWSGSAIVFNRANNTALFVINTGTVPTWSWQSAMDFFISRPAYSASIAINAALGNVFTITATNGTAFTVANPTNASDGRTLTVTIRNTSGGALGVVTWDTQYKLAAWTSPANGFSRSITFIFDNALTVWREQTRTTVDVPN